MIQRMRLRRFKRYSEEEITFSSFTCLVGRHDCGKSTVLQAIAAWGLAFDRWKRANDFNKHGGSFARVPITRQIFSAVPLRTFEIDTHDAVEAFVKNAGLGFAIPYFANGDMGIALSECSI